MKVSIKKFIENTGVLANAALWYDCITRVTNGDSPDTEYAHRKVIELIESVIPPVELIKLLKNHTKIKDSELSNIQNLRNQIK